MKRIFPIAGGVLALLLVALAVLPFLIPDSVYREQVEEAVSRALGREVTLEGEVALSLLPRLSARIGDVTLANPEGFSRKAMLTAGELRGVVRWAPLLSRRVEVAELVFVDADLMLERRADGQANWRFALQNKAALPQEQDEPGSAGVRAGIDRARLDNARLAYVDRTSGADYRLSDLDLSASVQALDRPLTLAARGRLQQTAFTLDLELDSPDALLAGRPAEAMVRLASDVINARLAGTAQLGEAGLLDATFDVGANDLDALARLIAVEPPQAIAALGRVNAQGRLGGTTGAPTITLETASVRGDLIKASASGSLALGAAPRYGLDLAAQTSDLGRLATALGLTLPVNTSLLEAVAVSGRLEGEGEQLALSGADIRHTGRLFDAAYSGRLALGAAGASEGRLTVSSERLREAASAFGMALPDTLSLQTLTLQTGLAANPAGSEIALPGLALSVDDIATSGDLTLSLAGARPRLSGALRTGRLDLTPFLAGNEAAPAEEAPGDWSTAKIDTGPLLLADADLQLGVTTLKTGPLTFTDADLLLTLENGLLNVRVREAKGIGGTLAGGVRIDGRGAVPGVSFDVDGRAIEIASLLGPLAGLDALSGVGRLTLDVEGTGATPQAILASLDGMLSTELADGALRGLNIAQLVRSRETLVEALARGELPLALSPEAQTDFTRLTARLDIFDGIAALQDFELVNPVLSLTGTGAIDLAGRSLDVGLIPAIDTTGRGEVSALQLNGVPVPFRITGTWLSPSISPDMRLIRQLLADDLTGRIGEEIGGDLGSLLDEVLGGSVPPSADKADADGAPGSPEEALERAAEDIARDALGGLFGRRDREDDAER